MHVILDDLEEGLRRLSPDELYRVVVAEESPDYPGCLVFQPFDDAQMFYARHDDWLSRHLVLNELFMLDPFVKELQDEGFTVVFGPSARPVLEAHRRWSQPLRIPGYNLHPYQNFSLNRALERARNGATATDRLWFWNWSAGAGKTYVSGAGARALFDSGDIDLVIGCTLSKLKIGLCRTWTNDACLAAVINDHPRPAERRRRYHDASVQAWVMNYEKLRVDFDDLAAITADRRVLFVLDEAHKVITDGSPNQARKALDRLVNGCHAIVWPMSATVVGGNPLRFRDVFSLDGRPATNPLGTKKDFVATYADEAREVKVRSRSGRSFVFTAYRWNLPKLQNIRHRIGDRAMAVRKTDPGIRESFRGIECLPVLVEPTPEQRRLFGIITDLAAEAKDREETITQHYLALRIAAINPGALAHSDNEVAQQIVRDHPDLIDARHSAKIETINELLESIRESQDKAVLFCHWTELGLLPLAKHLTVPHVLHYGTGQSARESQAAVDRFKSDPDITCFASSDAGTYGLNLQCARYVINADPTYSYDDLAQRNARIDRADSHLDGLTAYVLITEGSVEERVWAVCNERRELAAAVQGTQEALSYGAETSGSRTELGDLDYLIFGGGR